MPASCYYLLLLLLLSFPATAQQFLSGKIRRRSSTEIIPSVSVINISQKRTNISDMGGNYKIPARPGDTITFSSAGYLPDTAIVSDWMFKEKDGYLVALQPHIVALPSVQVDEGSNYRLDSLKRSEDYAWVYPVHRRRLIGSETPVGFGVIISPLDYFGKKETQKRRLRKRLKQEEIDYYIDFRFPAAYVSKVTGLQGDSLRVFMYRYRPSYKWCRGASNEDILLYINDKLKKYHQGY
ncbi:MAG: hypothetical protein JST68_09090 [Bacteroidetes bacterium]|nr:hypothetical protein [Bacteroidota bacterium]